LKLAKSKRIIVIGPNGAGKSSFSRIISNLLNIEVFHLDKIYWKSNWKPITNIDFTTILSNLMKKNNTWILDGDYSAFMEERFEKADCVVWINYSKILCIINILKRYIKNRNSVRIDMADGCKERITINFILYLLSYNKRSKGKTKNLLKSYTGECIQVTSYKAYKELSHILTQLNGGK
jgi:adenylate kinase family enzyme